jgi:hypothetical protein
MDHQKTPPLDLSRLEHRFSIFWDAFSILHIFSLAALPVVFYVSKNVFLIAFLTFIINSLFVIAGWCIFKIERAIFPKSSRTKTKFKQYLA